MDRIPKYQDEVKHRLNDAAGVVIAKYLYRESMRIDVRSSSEEKIYYTSPIENWEVVRTAEERGQV